MSVLWQQRTHGVQRLHQRQHRAVALLFLGIVLVMTILVGAYVSLAASNVDLGRRVWDLEQALADWERENQLLIVEISRQSSIPALQQRAMILGYVPAESADYVEVAYPMEP
jgi:hypothetical protein